MQELKQIKLTDAIGKKIKAVRIERDKHVIVYDDGSFSFFQKYEEWGSDFSSDIELKYEKFIDKLGIREDGSTYFTSTKEMLIAVGVLDRFKLIEDAKERIEKYVEEKRERRYKLYKELEKEFTS